MIYNEFHGKKLSRLGFGCMRFKTDETGEIDLAKVKEMFKKALEGGVNYFDTAYTYVNTKSELAIAEALKDVPRESYFLADKFPGHTLPGPVDNGELFEVQLKKCGTDYFDFYLLHNVNEGSMKVYGSDEYHVIPDIVKKKEEGKIRHFGFSFHGSCELLESFLDAHPGMFDFVQIQCNYLDWTLQDAKRKYDIITSRGLGVWVMEPCRGGKLANLMEEHSARLKEVGNGGSDASYAFRFVQGLPGIKMILSGMNEPEQVEDNLATFETYRPLSQEETDVLMQIAEEMKKGVPCTGCRYCCDGCPMGLDIPYLLDCYNSIKVQASVPSFMRIDALDEDKRPGACIGCGQCARACPQGIDVPSVLAELDKLWKEGPKWSELSKGRRESIKVVLGLKD